MAFIVAALTVMADNCFAQSEYLPLEHDLNFRIGSGINSLSSRAHTSLQPYEVSRLGQSLTYDSLIMAGRLYRYNGDSWIERKVFTEHLLQLTTDEYKLSLDFLPELGLGKDVAADRLTWFYTRGFEFAGSIGSDFSFRTQHYEAVGKFPLYIDAFIKKTAVVPGQGYKRYYGPDDYEYGYSMGTISYSPSKYFNILLGQDKNFIGDGYRSMLLSDLATNYPFLKLTGYVWDLQYSIMWAQFQEPTATKANDHAFWPKKYGVFHYLDWNITNKFSIGFFEAVMWKAVDSLYGYRGFDLNYLVPLVIFRPVEYSMGSPDKMKVGLNAKYKITDHITSYGQILLDEMVVSEYVHDRGFWANKAGFQFGAKSFNLLGIDRLSALSEFNTATPYTYSHWDYMTNYGHYEQPLAHPLGANFYEWVTIANYRTGRFELRTQFNVARYGDDSTGVNFGKDIYKPYTTRYRDYGNYTAQGIKTDLFIADLRVAYVLNPLINLRIELGVSHRNKISDLSSEKSTWITLGIRSSLRNIYYDF